jgi:hypothetical protein
MSETANTLPTLVHSWPTTLNLEKESATKHPLGHRAFLIPRRLTPQEHKDLELARTVNHNDTALSLETLVSLRVRMNNWLLCFEINARAPVWMREGLAGYYSV